LDLALRPSKKRPVVSRLPPSKKPRSAAVIRRTFAKPSRTPAGAETGEAAQTVLEQAKLFCGDWAENVY